MTFVPLSLGIKIRPDDEYYTSRAVEAYKVIAQQLMQDMLQKEHHQQAAAANANAN